jgi:hypothetical protein
MLVKHDRRIEAEMNFARILLFLNGAAFVGYGLACLISPSLAADSAGFSLGNTSGTVEVVAMYGGLQMGVGALLFLGGMRAERQEMALLVVVVLMGSLATARLFGIVMHGASAYNLGALGYEAVTALLAAVALRGQGGVAETA